ncbi:ABC transporter permease subunit [Horticoccus sp. 23ND18S-11]|uniref:ABC transporter permease subunit n=1 Tax=Horticoccus sp. 23ND18S-11 TaxID=3391832 RepID=UPI0039C9C394
MSAVPFSPYRTLLIAQNTLREAARQKLVTFLVFLALALVLGARWFRDFNFGAPELKFLADCGFGAMAFFGAALTVAATAQLFFSEIENRTALTLLAKPVWRAEFILGKFLGIAALAGVFCVLLTSLLAAVLWWREGELMQEYADNFAQGRVVSYRLVALAGLMQWLKLTILAAFSLLVATFAQTQLFTVVTGFFILVICHLQYLAQDAYARGGALLGRMLGGGIAAVFPNFQVFAVADSLNAADAPPWAHVARIGVYAFGYIAVACGLAIFSFRRREI